MTRRNAAPTRSLAEMSLQWLKDIGAIRTNDHFVYTSGQHGSNYVSKEVIASYPSLLAELGHFLAEVIGATDPRVEVIVAPAVGALTLGHEATIGLTHQNSITRARGPVRYAYAKKRGDEFKLHPVFVDFIRGKKVGVVEDILTTGSSASSVVEAVRQADGEVIIVAALLNRGGVTNEQLGVPTLVSLIDISFDQYEADSCPLCAKSMPINAEFGHGAEFLARQKT